MQSELELRLTELEHPDAQGDPLDWRGFIKLAVLTVIIPVAMIIVGWMLLT